MNAPKGKPAVVRGTGSGTKVGPKVPVKRGNVHASGKAPKNLVQNVAQKGKSMKGTKSNIKVSKKGPNF